MKDLTVLAIPFFFGSMGAEYVYLRQQGEKAGAAAARVALSSTNSNGKGVSANGKVESLRPRIESKSGRDIAAGLYERQDTIASLTMGVGSLVLPFVMPRVLRPITPGKGKYGKALVAAAAAAAAVTTVADLVRDRNEGEAIGDVARRVAEIGGPVAIVTGGVAFTTAWTNATTPKRLWDKRIVKDLGAGIATTTAAIAGWDFIYYWNHRFMHEVRSLWAIHVVHHSSERYNLSTALRQPVADAFGAFLPYGALSFLGIRPAVVETARGVNLLYQYWIHTETIDKLGPAEEALNTPSHHRVHHGSNGRYLDRNHGSILIIWDRLFGTFEREDEPVRYGLTKNINTFNPLRVASHEHVEMLRDVSKSRTWKDRLSFVLRGPGWAGRRRAEWAEEAAAAELLEAVEGGTPEASYRGEPATASSTGTD